MVKLSPLTLTLLEKRPITAIKVLTAMSPGDAAAFFEALPPPLAVSLVARISAWSASLIIAEMKASGAAAILSELDYQTTVSIMRVLPDPKQSPLLEMLPRRLRRDLAATLSFPTNTVGAKMSINIVVMAADQTVGDAFSQLRQIKNTRSGVAFVVDGSRRILGVVNAAELLQRPNEAMLGEVMDASVKPLSARASLSAAKLSPAWDDYAYLPVVDRKNVLIGALARRAFRQLSVDPSPNRPNEPSLLGSVAGAFFDSSVGLARVLGGLDARADQELTGPSQPESGKSL